MFQSLYIIERDKDFELLIMGKEDFVQNDFLLIRKMKQGDDDALDLFVHKYYQDILNYCHYHCSDKTYAEDLAQETFVHFFSKLSDYHYRGKTFVAFTDGQGNFQETEVSKAVYMEFCHFIKRERNLRRSDERHLEQSELTEETLCRRAVHKPKPVDDAVNDNIRMERLNRAIMELPEIQKRRFMLHFDLGLTYEQIGAMEGCTKMPIKRSIDRAIEKIRLALKNF